ncbi:uncharacterized protein [Pocillopora verrucosa]|uniref:uncharacterized protein n=1 Tax=Pocillopora verrucosa TaxID=203993 RepID=UPI00333F1533
MECRRRLIEHAVKHLTTERDTSVCVQRDHVRKVWSQLQETWVQFNYSSDEERKNIEKEISQWELFHKSQVQTRKPSDLRVCYLAGDNPTNGLEVLVNIGILPQNVWMVEKNGATFVKTRESIRSSNLRTVRLFKGDILVFLKDFEGQFDIIYCDARDTLPAAKQKTLKFIGYVFLYDKLTSPGALITNFSFPPLGQQQQAPIQEGEAGKDLDAMTPDEVGFPNEAREAKPADFERYSLKELSVGYLKHRSTNILHDICKFPEEIASALNLRTDEENYGDYITYQVIDSAYLYIPIQRMLMATKHGSSFDLWDQIFQEKEEFLGAVSLGLKAATATDLNSQATSGEMKYFFETIKESYLRHIALIFQEKSLSNNLCAAWITELFPDLGKIKNQGIASLLMTHLLSYSSIFIQKFANGDMKKYCLKFLCDIRTSEDMTVEISDEAILESILSMVAGLWYGQITQPSFPVVDKLLRLSYTGNKSQMFSDVFIFDKCRYVYQQFSTVDTSTFAFYELHQQRVLRMVVDGLRKHLGGICKLDIFPCVNVAGIKTIDSTAFPSISERQRVKELMHDELKKMEMVKEENYEEAMV